MAWVPFSMPGIFHLFYHPPCVSPIDCKSYSILLSLIICNNISVFLNLSFSEINIYAFAFTFLVHDQKVSGHDCRGIVLLLNC